MGVFILLAKTKKECIYLKNEIELFLEEKLHLKLNNKSRYYPSAMGVNFCGYRIFSTHKLLRLNSKKKIKRRVKKWNYLYHSKRLNFKSTLCSLNSWKGHASHCNTYKLQEKIYNSCDFLYKFDIF